MTLVSREEILASLDQSQRSKAIFEWMQKLKKKLDDYVKKLSNSYINKEIEWQKIEEDIPVLIQLLAGQSDDQLWCHTELHRMGLFLSWRIFRLSPKKNAEAYTRVSNKRTFIEKM